MLQYNTISACEYVYVSPIYKPGSKGNNSTILLQYLIYYFQ